VDHYIDIKILPDPEFAPSLLMNALHGKLHRALVQLDCNDIGLSFPDYSEKPVRLGDRMRLHGNRQRLTELMATNWLTGMRDHVRVGEVAGVPDTEQVIVVRRAQVKSSAARIRRRQIRRHGFSEEEALQRIPDSIEKRLDLPFLTSRSQSSEQVFRLFIRQTRAVHLVKGGFNSYGLSGEATLPCF
jgi:CRISPR-associated endonuclease Csy4